MAFSINPSGCFKLNGNNNTHAFQMEMKKKLDSNERSYNCVVYIVCVCVDESSEWWNRVYFITSI